MPLRTMRSLSLSSAILLVCLNGAAARAQDAPPEHPVVKPMRGATAGERSRMDEHGQLAVRYRDGARSTSRTVEGRYWRLEYRFASATPPSSAEVLANYVAETERVGGDVLNRTATRLLFRLPHEGGGTTWCRVAAVSAGRYELEIVDEAALVPSLAFDAEALREALDRDGRVPVYGILFDVDRATLRPGSGQVLDEVARLLLGDPALSLEVQGHTDSTGAAARNRELSLERAQAVVHALGLYGVAGNRLVAKGYGPDRPVADNATEAGRQQNRRVELVKR